jgi:hypothetical protein
MKTPIQELIETFEEMRSPIDNKVDVDFAISLMKSMLEKEKEQIMDAYNQGLEEALQMVESMLKKEKDEIIDAHIDGQCDDTDGTPFEKTEQYYNDTFNTKER